MSDSIQTKEERFNQVDRYNSLMDVVRNRMTNRAFDPDYVVPREHFEMILDAARHSPSGANSQPWNYIVVTDPKVKERLGQRFMEEQQTRGKLKMRFPTPNYKGMKTAPGLIVVVADFRYIQAFPVLNDGSQRDEMYKSNAERILLQSLAASVMSAHLAAAALGYAVWWVTAIGQEAIQKEFRPLLKVPEQLAIIDIICFGPPLKPSYKRWKKELSKIMSWGEFNPDNFLTDEELNDWIQKMRHKVMYRDQTNID